MSSDRRAVCLRCAQIKQACDGQQPCSRCVRLGLPCRPRDQAHSRSGKRDRSEGFFTTGPSDAESLDELRLPKARIRRVQTGCLMCKRRKKKCDEIKPSCGDCQRLSLECVWPFEKSRASSRTSVPTTSAVSQSSSKTHHGPLPTMTLSAENLGMAHDLTVNYDELANDFSFPALSSSSSSPRSSAMDSAHGVSEPIPMVLSNSHNAENVEFLKAEELFWAETTPEIPWLDSNTPTSHDISAGAVTLSTYVPRILPQLTSAIDRALLNHFTQVVSVVMTRHPVSTNPFSHYLLPLAHSNDLLLHCILGLAGNHWGKTQPEMGSRGLVYQSRAQQALAQLLPHVSGANLDVALACSLVLCMTEFYDGTSQGWQVHLRGAKRLMGTWNSNRQEVWPQHCKFLLRLSWFLDSTTAVATCMPVHTHDNRPESSSGLAAMPEEEDSALYGIPKEMLCLINAVNRLAEKRKYRIDSASDAKFREDASNVEEMIDTWSYEHAGLMSQFLPAPADTLSNAANRDRQAATLAYEYAIRLRLHQLVEGYNIHDARTVSLVGTILDSIQQSRYGSPLEACLVYPVVMAGSSCRTLEERAILLDRLVVMERTIGFGYVYNARALVERVWARRDELGGPATEQGATINWAKMWYEEMHGLVVF